ARLREAGRLSAEEFSRRVTACLEPRLGVLGEVTERDFTQLPLAVSHVQVSDPVLLLGPGVPLPVATGSGLSLADARAAAAPPGAAAGHDWQEAVRTGLCRQCRRLTLAEVTQGRYPFTPIDWHEVALDVSGGRYRSLVKIIGKRLDVYDVTGSPRVPTLAFCL